MGISNVSSSPVWFGGSLIIFQLFRCRNMALNMFFPTFLSGRHVFILGRHLDTPYICTPPYVHMPLGVQMLPHMSPILLCICIFSEASACCGELYRPLTCWTPPLHAGHLPLYWMCFPIHLTPSTHWLASLCICMFLGISACDMGNIPLMLGVWGVPPYVGVCRASASLGVCMLHYVSHTYHDSDYYSSSYGGVFWAVI